MIDFIVPTTNEIPDNPRVRIFFRGLGAVCFNEDAKRAEIGYIAAPDHAPYILIMSSKGDIIKDESMAGKNLVIDAFDGNTTEAFYQTHDPRNLDLLLDLSEFYGESNIDPNASFQSKIYIEDAVFYTDPQCPLIKVEPFNDADANETYDIKRISSAAYAAVKSNTISIKYGSEEILLDDELTYNIFIRSNCPHPELSDFKYYYDIIQNGGAIRYNLKTVDENFWLTDLERAYLKDLGTLLDDPDLTEDLDAAIVRQEYVDINPDISYARDAQLKYLEDILCFPGPCLLVTFGHKTRSLP